MTSYLPDDYPPGPNDHAVMYALMWEAVQDGFIVPTATMEHGRRVFAYPGTLPPAEILPAKHPIKFRTYPQWQQQQERAKREQRELKRRKQ